MSHRSTPPVTETSLAYIFWHRPRRAERRAEYEAALRAFHRSLRMRPPSGLLASSSLHSRATPWASRVARPTYEDTYYLDDFGRLASIVEVAYESPWVRAHREVASRADFGVAALYVNRDGRFPPDPPEVAAWFPSPSLARVQEIRRTIQPLGACLWQRHLALGPSPEFVIRGPARLARDRHLRALLPSARWLSYRLVDHGKVGEGKGWRLVRPG